MVCPRCHTFVGDPCNSCRTLARAKYLLEGGKLLRTQESLVLGALRGLAGALSDLAEEAAPILAAELRTSGFPGAPSSGGVEVEESKEELKEEVKPRSPGEENDGDTKKAKKRRTKKEGKKLGKRRKDEKADDKKRERSKSDSPRARAADRGEASSARRSPREEPRLEGLGLNTLPRGSAGKHFAERIPAGARAPPEPPGAPPRYSERDWERGDPHRSERYTRERSKSRTRRGTKGKQHRARAAARAQNWAQWGRR